MERFLTRTQLQRLLTDRGHVLWSATQADLAVDVWPPTERIMTVALDPDGTLKSDYRHRYFACVRDAEDEPLILHHPAFALAEPFVTAAEREPVNNYFMLGPVRWLLVRLRRFSRVLLWPRGGFRGADGRAFLLWTPARGRTEPTPHLDGWFERSAPDASQVCAALLDLNVLADCQVLWEAANLVGRWSYDFFLSDEAGCEVYLLHHHDKIVISIPDDRAHRELLEGLGRHGEVLVDCSGYELEGDQDIDWNG
jgi:hypothetical protein